MKKSMRHGAPLENRRLSAGRPGESKVKGIERYGEISDVTVRRGAPCGATREAAKRVKGYSIDDAPAGIGRDTPFFCTADPANRDPIWVKRPVHLAADPHGAALAAALKKALEETGNQQHGRMNSGQSLHTNGPADAVAKRVSIDRIPAGPDPHKGPGKQQCIATKIDVSAEKGHRRAKASFSRRNRTSDPHTNRDFVLRSRPERRSSPVRRSGRWPL